MLSNHAQSVKLLFNCVYLGYINLTIKVATSGQRSWHCKHFCIEWSSPPSSFPSRNANKYKMLFEIWWTCSRFPENMYLYFLLYTEPHNENGEQHQLECLTPVRSNNLFLVYLILWKLYLQSKFDFYSVAILHL